MSNKLDEIITNMPNVPSIIDNKNYDDYKIKNDPVKRELIEKIMRQTNSIYLDNEDVVKLITSEFKDSDTIKLIFKWYAKRIGEIAKKANLFRENIIRRYSYLPKDKLIKKAKKYADALHMTDLEFKMFQQMYEINYKSPLDKDYDIEKKSVAQTEMGKLFNVFPVNTRGKLVIKDDDNKIVDQMISDYKASEQLYYMTFLNSIKYQDCDLDRYKDIPIQDKIDIKNCVDPVIAAMFIPKIKFFESRFIMQSIGKLVKDCYEHKELKGFSLKLRNTIVTDKSQYYDQSNNLLSAIKDLQLRANIQYNVWWQVICLRNKKFLETKSEKFYKALSNYAPDMFIEKSTLFENNSIGIIRRLYNAMSVHTITATRSKTDSQYSSLNKYYDLTNASEIPFVIIKNEKGALEMKKIDDKNKKKTIDIPDKTYKDLQFIFVRPGENNNLTKIINEANDVNLKLDDDTPYKNYSMRYTNANCVVTFIILRTSNIKDKDYKHNGEVLINFDSFETEINTDPVIFDHSIQLGAKDFTLRSVVLTGVNKIDSYNGLNNDDNNIDIKLRGNPYSIIYPINGGKPLVYAPFMANKINNGHIISPITQIEEDQAKDFCQRYSEIFIYANNDDDLTEDH
jgi:hypothetical protein